jgi:hypothetical protein
MGKGEKRKKKRISRLNRSRGWGGGFGPVELERGWPAHLGPPMGATWSRRRGRGPTCQRGERETASGGENGGLSTGRKNGPPVAQLRFSAGDPVLGGRGGGIARAGVGGHGGGVDLAGGGSGQTIHSEVVGSRGGEVSSEAYGA